MYSRWLRALCLIILCCSSAIPQAGQSVDPYGFEERSGGPPGALMGMRMEKAQRSAAGVAIVTTGSEFSLADDGILRCFQRIPLRREIARVALPKASSPWQAGPADEFRCVFYNESIQLEIHGDSVIILGPKQNGKLGFTGLFEPAYHAGKDGRWIFIDSQGGFGIYPVEKKTVRPPALQTKNWNVQYTVKENEEIWLSVFPPRPYNWRRAMEPIAHEGSPGQHCPTDKLIRSAARFCKIFVVHSYFWPGGDREPWIIPRFVPEDMLEFSRMRDEVHRNGMKLVPYFSPYYYSGNDFFGEIRRALDEYRVDGLYFDGISMDFRKSYHVIRLARQILGPDRILYVHCSSDPLSSTTVYCPFIDAYADFLLRGEAGRGDLSRDDFVRWVLSGYNISNAVGYWCYYGSTGKAGYVADDPTHEDIEVALKYEVRIPRTEVGFEVIWKEDSGHLDQFDKVYFGRLDQLRRQHSR